MLVVAVQGAQRLKDLSAQLKQAGRGDLQMELRAAIRTAAGPALADTRAAILGLRIKGTRGGGRRAREEFATQRVRTEGARERARRRTGLRRTVAAATGLRVRARGVTIECNSSRMPADQRNLPRALDSPRGWRHPVYGNREVWAHQMGGPWFYKTLLGHAPAFRKAISDAMDDIAARISD